MYEISRGVVGALISGNVAMYSGDCGFALGCEDSMVIGNHAEGCDHAGIFCAGKNNLIANNVCIANGKRNDKGGTGRQGHARSGIVINNEHNFICGNICFDDDLGMSEATSNPMAFNSGALNQKIHSLPRMGTASDLTFFSAT